MSKTPASEFTPEQRFTRVAAILALGVRRQCQLKRRYETQIPDSTAEAEEKGLEVLGETRLSVTRFQG